MRKAIPSISLTLILLGATARAEETVPAAPAPVAVAPRGTVVAPAPTPAVLAAEPAPVVAEYPKRRLDLGASFLGMGLGRVTVPGAGGPVTGDALFGYGVGISVNYRIIAGLSVGLMPQAIFDVNSKVNLVGVGVNKASTEYDVMGRLAYTFPIIETVALYLEALPGYSLKSGDKWSKGFVLAVGAGLSLGLTERTFVTLGGGYQKGYQSISLSATSQVENRESYVRIAVGGGVRF
jgi:hypothetical protein